MTSNRPYRNGMTFKKALQIIDEGMGTQWDPDLANLFLKLIHEGVFIETSDPTSQFNDYVRKIS
jgi:HD-GYP domain-containing protein (c-di-GMP phosphodiesterase class II)